MTLSKTPELELKFNAPPDLDTGTLAAKGGIDRVVELPPLDLLATYYDTDDLRLARARLTLRYRIENKDKAAEWTVKLPTADASQRTEVSMDGTAAEIPADAEGLVTAFVRGRALSPVVTLHTQRRRWSLRDKAGEELAELTDDQVSVRDGRRVKDRFRELELEARSLDAPGLEQLAHALEDLGAARAEPLPKAIRALGLSASAPSDLPEPQPVSPRDDVSKAARAALAGDIRRLVVNDPLVRLRDEEAVHQMRVAARRLRVYLRAFSPLLDLPRAEHTIRELRWLGRTLGQVRDQTILIGRLRAAEKDIGPGLEPMVGALTQRTDRAWLSLQKSLAGVRYRRLLDAVLAAAASPPTHDQGREASRSALPHIVAAGWDRLRNAVSDLKDGQGDAEYHKVRIRGKRVRYLAEAAAPCLGRRKSDAVRFARHAEEVQNILGMRQDLVITRQTLLEEAGRRPTDGPFNLAAGRLLEREQQLITEYDWQFGRVWRAFNRKKNRDWLTK